MESTLVVTALLLGFLPALFWLWFWLREDKARPEPGRLILTAFIAGIAVVPLVLPVQRYASEHFSGQNLIFIFVVVEEVLKYSAALLVVLWNKAVDEPIDCIVYMITIALGFAALENALFIFNPLADGELVTSIQTGNFRFLGATLLHVLASGTVGVMMALAFYKKKAARILYATIGLCIAIVLHVLFNFFIMTDNGETVLGVFFAVWMGIIVLFLVFEKIKLIEKNT
jgi:protease PrsW